MLVSSQGFQMMAAGQGLDESISSSMSMNFEQPKLKLADEELLEKYA
jgi:hypothetical protein